MTLGRLGAQAIAHHRPGLELRIGQTAVATYDPGFDTVADLEPAALPAPGPHAGRLHPSPMRTRQTTTGTSASELPCRT